MKKYTHPGSLPLEGGGQLEKIEIAYTDEGATNKPVVWVCHALTANADVFDWWNGLFGPGHLFNPDDYRIVCANVLGSCYGSTGPTSVNPATDKPYYHDFPVVTIRDMVQAHELLRKHLGIECIHLLIGGSKGGQQALEWAYHLGNQVEQLALIATNARHSAWGIAFNASQRMAIETDPSWQEWHEKAGDAGMRVARSIALLSYRYYEAYGMSQTDDDEKLGNYKASSYQQYQGEKLSRRFNAFSYFRLSQAMDTHHIGRGRGPIPAVLAQVKAQSLVVGIDSDILFPAADQVYLAKYLPNCQYQIIHSDYGHDGFLIETGQLTQLLHGFLSKNKHAQQSYNQTPHVTAFQQR